jgi:hypothetical protein
MSKRIIVTTISDQAAQNVLFIKEMNIADYYYFISTHDMEEKDQRKASKHIMQACNINEGKANVIIVQEDSLKDIESKLQEKIEINDEDQIMVNITGGTKIMSLGVYNFFSRQGSARIFYIPIGKNKITQVFPLRRLSFEDLNGNLNLKEYVSSYGVTFDEKSFARKNLVKKEYGVSEKIMSSFIRPESRKYISEVSELIRTNNYRGNSIKKNGNENERHLFEICKGLSSHGMTFNDENAIDKDETKYLTGEWFEEYIYHRIKTLLNIDDEHIGLGLILTKGNSRNEYDVIFTKKNALYVIECKTDVSDNNYGEEGKINSSDSGFSSTRNPTNSYGEEGKISMLFTSTLYKAATLKKEFGLWVNYYLFALNDFSKLSKEHLARAKRLEIKLVGTEIMNNDEEFEKYIRNM